VTLYKIQKSILSLKSWLFTPATKSDKFSRAAEVHADALIIDLEDSVAPSGKREARETAFRYLPGILPGHLPGAISTVSSPDRSSSRTVSKRWVSHCRGQLRRPSFARAKRSYRSAVTAAFCFQRRNWRPRSGYVRTSST
jgi:hypothetical protein